MRHDLPFLLHRALRPFVLLPLLFAAAIGPAVAQPAADDYVDDFSGLGWTPAFDAMHETMQRKYTFGEWKHAPWAALADDERAKIVVAEQQQNASQYYLALREYLLAIPDNHLVVASDPGNPCRQRSVMPPLAPALG